MPSPTSPSKQQSTAAATKLSRVPIGFENMPCVDYATVFPLTTKGLLLRTLQSFIKIPIFVALAAMALQYGVFCKYTATSTVPLTGASSPVPGVPLTWGQLLWGLDASSTAYVNGDRLTNETNISGDVTNTVVGTFAFENLRGYAPGFYLILLPFIFRTLTTIICHTFYITIEKKGWLKHYKIPRTPQTEPSDELRMDSYKTYAVDLFIVGPLVLWALTHYNLVWEVRDVCEPIAFVPTTLFIIFCFFFNETGFYWSHRTLHEFPFLYKHFHKKHHKYIGSISIAAEYATPVEGAFSNALPLLGPLFFLPISPLVFSVWFVVRLMETFESHSGYCFDGCWLSRRLNMTHSGYAMFHDYHHVANKGNYGQGGLFWDYVCGTDLVFRSKLAAAAERKRAEKAK